jgi:hypothetical protein
MKLNINPKELLALYNLLHERLELCQERDVEGDDVQLRLIYGRLRAIIIAGLTSKAVDPVDSWLGHEQSKVNKLSEQNESLKAEVRDFGGQLPSGGILTDDEGEVPSDLAYPNRFRRPPPPNLPRPGRHSGRHK